MPIARQNRYRYRAQFLLPPDALSENIPMHPGASSFLLLVPRLLSALRFHPETGDTYRFVHLPASYGQGHQYRLHTPLPDGFSPKAEHKSYTVCCFLPVPFESSFPGCHKSHAETHTLLLPVHPCQQKQRYGRGRSHTGFPAAHNNPVPHPGFPFGSNISVPGKNCRWGKAGKRASSWGLVLLWEHTQASAHTGFLRLPYIPCHLPASKTEGQTFHRYPWISNAIYL